MIKVIILPFCSNITKQGKQHIKNMSDFNILGIDGGGSRGIMEAAILQDLMNTTTMLRDHPAKLLEIISNERTSLFQKKETREAFSQVIGEVKNPIHPTEAFDMIAGSSTGALVTFALVGGKEDPKTGKRVPMTLPEIIDFYKVLTPEIFVAFKGLKKYSNGILKAKMGLQLDPFDHTGLLNVLRKYWGHTTLQDIDNNCIGLAILKRMEHNSEVHYDSSETFDTRSYESIEVVDVLMAAANAPIIFKTPWIIRGRPYVDGGTHANCPLGLAIPRMKELSNGNLQSILSVAPSRPVTKKEPDGLTFWMGYFADRTFDAYNHYMDAKRLYPPGNFVRLWPKSKKFVEFDTDDLRLAEMLEGVEEEKLEDPVYLQDIIVSALAIAARLPNQDMSSLFKIAKIVMQWNMLSDNAEKGLYVARAFAKIQITDDLDFKNDVICYLAVCYYGMNMLGQAYEEFQKINMNTVSDVKYWTMKGVLNYHKGNFEVAEQDLKHAKSVEESPFIKMYLSKTLASMDKKNEALEVAQGTSFDGTLDDEFIQIEMLIENDKVDQALELLKKLTIAEDSDEMAKLASLTGQCHFKKGNIEDSLKEHDKAIDYWEDIFEREEETEMIHAYFHAGLAFKFAHQAKKALVLLEKANVNAMKMYKGIDLNKHPWFVQLTDAIKEARIAAKSEVKKVQMDKPRNLQKRKKKVGHNAQVASDVAGLVVGTTGKVIGGVHSLMKGLFKR